MKATINRTKGFSQDNLFKVTLANGKTLEIGIDFMDDTILVDVYHPYVGMKVQVLEHQPIH